MTTANYKDLPCLACDSAGSVDERTEPVGVKGTPLYIPGKHVTVICRDCDGIGYLVAKRAEEQRESQAATMDALRATFPGAMRVIDS